MEHTKLHLLFLSLLILSFSVSCKKSAPTGPDPGDGSSRFIEIKAVITLNGQPMAGIEVYLSGGKSEKTLSGADGSFKFTALPSGTYYITPSKIGVSFNPAYYQFSTSIENLSIVAQNATYGTILDSIMANFTAKNQNNLDVSLSDFFGLVILVNFSADWCSPCRAEAASLGQLYIQYKDRGFQVLTLLISGNCAEWADTYNLPFPVLNDLQRAVYNLYTNGYVPLNILLGRNCNILYEEDGFNETEIIEWIEKFL